MTRFTARPASPARLRRREPRALGGSVALELTDVAHGAARGAGGHQRVGLQRLRDGAVAVGAPGVLAARHHGGAPLVERGVADDQVDLAAPDVDPDLVAFFYQPHGPTR